MLIKNLTSKKMIDSNARFCKTIFSKFIGLMFSKKQMHSLVFKFDNEIIISLHMFFVFYPIDVIFLDKKNRVVDLKENFLPFTFYSSKKNAMYAIEMPKGTISNTATKIGDKIKIR